MISVKDKTELFETESVLIALRGLYLVLCTKEGCSIYSREPWEEIA